MDVDPAAALSAPPADSRTAALPDATPNETSPPPPAPAADPAAEKRVKNGTAFLLNPQVRSSPLSRRVNFLKSKGLSVDEILTCFREAGQPKTRKEIDDIINNVTVPATSSPSPAPSAAAPAPQVQYVQVPQQPPKPPPRDWRDYFIGATVGGMALWGISKVAQQYVDFSWKGQAPPPRQRGRPKGSYRTTTTTASDADTDRGTLPALPPKAPVNAVTQDDIKELCKRLDDVESTLESREQADKKQTELNKSAEEMLSKHASILSAVEQLKGKTRQLDRLVTRVTDLEGNMEKLKGATEDLARRLPAQDPEEPKGEDEKPTEQPQLQETPEEAKSEKPAEQPQPQETSGQEAEKKEGKPGSSTSEPAA